VERKRRTIFLILAFILAVLFLFAWGNGFNWPDMFSVSGNTSRQEQHSVDLSWTASTSHVSGYRVYVSAVSGGPYTLLTKGLVKGTTYTDTNVKSGKTYYYMVTSVDANGAESVASKEFTAKIP
jgi:fibronectin type 3 domain-containing protein